MNSSLAFLSAFLNTLRRSFTFKNPVSVTTYIGLVSLGLVPFGVFVLNVNFSPLITAISMRPQAYIDKS